VGAGEVGFGEGRAGWGKGDGHLRFVVDRSDRIARVDRPHTPRFRPAEKPKQSPAPSSSDQRVEPLKPAVITHHIERLLRIDQCNLVASVLKFSIEPCWLVLNEVAGFGEHSYFQWG